MYDIWHYNVFKMRRYEIVIESNLRLQIIICPKQNFSQKVCNATNKSLVKCWVWAQSLGNGSSWAIQVPKFNYIHYLTHKERKYCLHSVGSVRVLPTKVVLCVLFGQLKIENFLYIYIYTHTSDILLWPNTEFKKANSNSCT